MNRTLWHAGVILVAFGMMFAIVPTGSYSTIAGERVVGVSVAADDSALIALEDPGTTVTKGQETVVGTLVNNLDSGADVTYVASVDSSDIKLEKEGQQISEPLGTGETKDLVARCSSGQNGRATLTVTVDASNVDDSVVVSGATLRATVEYDCAGGAGENGPPDGTGPPTDTGNPN